MFVKLRMSIEEAITELGHIATTVYQRGLEPKERTARLKDRIELLLMKRGLPLDIKLEAEQQEGCVG